ncbi:MAG: MATE family efflux transporter [Bacteroidales bacterium]|nr:MATE family efflux transporter [Bacteroidales bacterium]
MVTGKKENKESTTLDNKTITDRLGHESIGKLLATYAIPAIVGTMVMSLYNIVDRIYIGQGVGAEAISGLALTFPVMTLSGACGMLIGAGAGARISIFLGKGDRPKAEKVLGNSLILVMIIASLYSLINFIWLKPILKAYGGTDVTLPYAVDYLKIIIPFTMLNNLSFGFNNMMRASGYPQKAMLTMMISALANVILDPIFIFGFKMGIEGAAIATVISMAITTVWVMIHFSNSNHTISFHKEGFKLNKRIIISIISIGMSPFLINVTASVVNVIMNRSLLLHGGDLAIGAFGIINSVSMVLVMLIIGLCQGMQPIVGYNYGARNILRVERAYNKTVIVATIISAVGFLLALFIPDIIVNGFTTDKELMAIAVPGLRFTLLAFPIVGFQIVTTNLFQSLGMAWKAIFLSLSRQVLFLIPLIWILPQFYDLTGVWIASPTSDVIAGIVAFFFLNYQWKRFKIAMSTDSK